MAKTNNLRDFLQGIANAIRTKKGTVGNINAQDFEDEIASIEGGGGVVDEYFYYSKAYYTITNNSTLFLNAWQDMKDSESVLFDIPLALAAPNQEMGGMTIDLYVGTNGQLQALYDACANETIPPPIDNDTRDVYYVNNVATYYGGDISGDVGFPIPLYNFGVFDVDDTSFLIGDLTPLSMGLGLVLAKIVDVSIPNNNIVIQQGFEFENESGIIIPDSITSIGNSAFYNWSANNQPLIIPNSVTSIGGGAFSYWQANDKQLIIPNSVTTIGNSAFYNWTSNNQPLIIPNSVTTIGEFAFYGWQANDKQLIIPNSVTTIGKFAFYGWQANDKQLIIPNSVTTIGNSAFYNWTLNDKALVIPNSVTTIGEYAFSNWQANDKQLIIPNSVTTIGEFAFGLWQSIPYVIIYATTPPTLANSNAFYNNSPNDNYIIYVPDASVDDYKTATQWINLASRIKGISEMP